MPNFAISSAWPGVFTRFHLVQLLIIFKMLLNYVGRIIARPAPLAAMRCSRQVASGAEEKYISVEPDSEMENVAVIKMQKKPVNSLCSVQLGQLTTALEEIAGDKKYKAAILTSAYPNIFSAGLDLMSMYGRSFDEVYDFWSALQKVWITLYGTPLITAAAINGNAPAGGCFLALSCDYRVMAEGKYVIGLNETRVGIMVAYWIRNTMLNVLGFLETERALLEGRLYSPAEAKAVRLVDAVTPADEVFPTCRDFIKKYLEIPYAPRYLTKQSMRENTIKELQSELHEEAVSSARFLTEESIQKNMEKYVQALQQKRKR